MKIKDIVNRSLVNLTTCESEPIHIPGSIQPHGFLIALSPMILHIMYCSGNTSVYTPWTYEQLLGKSFAAVFGHSEAERLQLYIDTLDTTFASPFAIHIAGRSYSGIVHPSDGLYIVEMEPDSDRDRSISGIYKQTRQFVGYMANATSLHMLCQAVADETRAITGYDRVMIYRFDKNYNGEVYAESKSESVEAFLGLHYPHTDIPPQARALYCTNLIRLIADVDYTPVPIYTAEDKTNTDLDLSYSILRSVSPIHVQYLHNMGVGASLSISLIHEGRLWGLIACHHYSPRPIDNYTRITAQLQGHFLTSQIHVREIAEEYEVNKQVNAALEKLLAVNFAIDRDSFSRMSEQPELLVLCNATGAAMLVDGMIYTAGLVPEETEIKKMANWFSTIGVNGSYRSSHLSSAYAEGKKIADVASGAIYQSLDLDHRNAIIWFREETLKEITWAGEPDKSTIKDSHQLTPRQSFAAWKETVKCQSQDWKNPELEAAANFAHALQKHIHTLFISEEEIKYRLLNIKLKEAYAELENLNWIASHDLKEPLRKIQVFASKIMVAENESMNESVKKLLHKIQGSAERMQNLIQDMLEYSKVRQINESFLLVDLNEILKDVTGELNEEITEKHAAIISDILPMVKGIPFLISQIFINLLRNALKFSKPNTQSSINVRYDGITVYSPEADMTADKYHKVSFHDNGIGFDNGYSQSIFKVFSRLHQQSEYGGTGVGLALCKKIMDNQGGYITAHGVVDEGAVFSLYFTTRTE
jgi:chemotaxis family two-component system sensor kinase Cph1